MTKRIIPKPYVIFMADLHLSPQRQDLITKFKTFINEHAQYADSIFILGDLFDIYLGTNDKRPHIQEVAKILRHAAQHTKIFILPGNRDFLLATPFITTANCQLLTQEVIVSIFKTPIMLAHGDTFCTLDHNYQKLRKILHHPISTAIFNNLPVSINKLIAKLIKTKSQQARRPNYKNKPETYQENPTYLQNLALQQNFDFLIFGHTHNPGLRRFAGKTGFVLHDWRHDGFALIYTQQQTWQSIRI